MSNSTITPNMNLIVPNVGVNGEPGPQYGLDQNQDLSILDSHNHSPGSGVQITPAGMDISTNLNFQNNSPYNVASIIFSAPATNATLTTLYTAPQSGGGIIDLFYNDGAGNVIALTKAGEVNASIASLPGESYAGGTFTWKQGNGSTTPANFDIGSITIRPNVAATTNGVVLGPPSAISSQYNVQLPIVPSVVGIMQLDTSGNMIATLVPDNSSIVISSQTLEVGPNGVTRSMLTPRTTGSTVGIGGFAISSSSGLFTTGSPALSPVTNLSVTITTNGGPVKLSLQADGSANPGYIQSNSTTTECFVNTSFFNGVTMLNNDQIDLFVNANAGSGVLRIQVPLGSFNFTDTSVVGTPGTYTYTFQMSAHSNVGPGGTCAYAVLTAYEF